MNGQVEKTHDFTLKMRKNMNITGVKDVINFDDSSVNLKTSIGDMTIDGKNIQISILDMDKGIVILEGNIDAVYYSEDSGSKEKRGLFGKIMK